MEGGEGDGNAGNADIYSHKAKTVESTELSPWIHGLLVILICIHLATGVGMLIMGIFFYTLCDDASTPATFVAGITPITATLFSLLGVIGIAALCFHKRLLSMANAFITIVVAAVITVNESAALRCTKADALDTTCVEFRSKLNMCRWFGSSHLITTATTIMAPFSNSSAIAPHPEYNTALRTTTITLAVVALINSIVLLALFGTAFKLGRPVYLRLKRHKSSIQVGKASNAKISNNNKVKNLEMTLARIQEEDGYNNKRNEQIKQYLTTKAAEGGEKQQDGQSETKDKAGPTKCAIPPQLLSVAKVPTLSAKSVSNPSQTSNQQQQPNAEANVGQSKVAVATQSKVGADKGVQKTLSVVNNASKTLSMSKKSTK